MTRPGSTQTQGSEPAETKQLEEIADAVVVDGGDRPVPYTPNVKSRFRVVAEYEISLIEKRLQEDIAQMRAQAAEEIRQWRRMLDHVERDVPAPSLPVQRRPVDGDPFAGAPDWAGATDDLVKDLVADHEELAKEERQREARKGRRR
jgi:hypothetical protein